MYEDGPKQEQVDIIKAHRWEKDAKRDFGKDWDTSVQPTAGQLKEWIKKHPKRQGFEE